MGSGTGTGDPDTNRKVFPESLLLLLSFSFPMQSLRNTLSGMGVCSEKLPGTRGEKIDHNLVKNKYAQSHFFFQSNIVVN